MFLGRLIDSGVLSLTVAAVLLDELQSRCFVTNRRELRAIYMNVPYPRYIWGALRVRETTKRLLMYLTPFLAQQRTDVPVLNAYGAMICAPKYKTCSCFLFLVFLFSIFKSRN